MAEEPAKTQKRDALHYTSTTLSKPKPVAQLPTPVRSGGGGGGQGSADIREAFQAIEPERGQWFLVAEKVANPGRFYDGFRGLGAQVKVNKNGKTTATDKDGKEVEVDGFDVYAMVPEGDLKPWKKGSAKQKAQAKMQANGAAAKETGQVAGEQPRAEKVAAKA